MLLVIVLALNMPINAQDLCGTQSISPPEWFFDEDSIQMGTQSIEASSYTLGIFIHIARNSSGVTQGINENDVLVAISSQLNMAFNNSSIQFQLTGYDYIDNDEYYTDVSSDAKFNALVNTNRQSNAINIYVLGTSTTTYGVAGAAASIPSTALWIHGNYHSTSVLSHEMGHCLGLPYTSWNC